VGEAVAHGRADDDQQRGHQGGTDDDAGTPRPQLGAERLGDGQPDRAAGVGERVRRRRRPPRPVPDQVEQAARRQDGDGKADGEADRVGQRPPPQDEAAGADDRHRQHEAADSEHGGGAVAQRLPRRPGQVEEDCQPGEHAEGDERQPDQVLGGGPLTTGRRRQCGAAGGAG
jgi:hypothetical protein